MFVCCLFKHLQVALVEPTISSNKIAWKQSGDWLTLPEFVAEHMIFDLPCNILTRLISEMKLTGHSKLTHPLKVEFFLKHMGKSEEEIATVLAFLKVRTRKKEEEKKEQEPGEEDWFLK